MTWEELVADVTARYPLHESKMFGMPCLKRENGKVVAGHWKDGGLTVKLTDTAQREAALAGGALPFDPGMGRVMKEWVLVPEAHSAFCRARTERFRQSDLFRNVFERIVGSCIEAGLVGGEGFAVDASLIEADANRQRSIPGQEWHKERDREAASRAVKEYLATLDEAAFGAATEVEPKFMSPSDPAAQWTGAHKGPAFFAYADNYLIDVRCGVIMDVEASRAVRQAEVGAARTMLERTEVRFGLKPQRLAADSAYGSAPMLNWLVEDKQITPHIPVIDKSKREDGTFSREEFHYDTAHRHLCLPDREDPDDERHPRE